MKFELEKFKQSNVARIFIAYAVVAFGMMQIFDYLLPIIEAPLWVAQTLTLLLFLGFPISLLVGWVTQRSIISSETEAADPEVGYAHSLSRQKLILIGLGSSAIFGFLGFVSLPYLLDQASFSNQAYVGDNLSQQQLQRSFRSTLMLGETGRRTIHNTRSDIAITADGTKLAYTYGSGNDQYIRIKDLTLPNSEREVGEMTTDGGSGLLFFSQDGEWLHFMNGGSLGRVRIEGGSFQEIDSRIQALRSGFTAFDETIIYSNADDGKLYKVGVAGGDSQILESMVGSPPERAYSWPRILPGNRYLLVTSSDNELQIGIGNIELHDLETGEIKVLVQSASNATYLNSGHIIFIRDSDIWAVGFELDSQEIVGSQVPIVEGVETNSVFGHAGYTVSDNGKLLYLAGFDMGATLSSGQLTWVNKLGNTIASESDYGSFAHIRLSPSESELAFTRFDDGAASDIFVWDLDRNTLGRRTFDGKASRPLWSPDGSQIFYSHETEGLRVVAANGTEQPRTIFSSQDSSVTPTSISPNGDIIFDLGTPRKVYMMDLLSANTAEQQAIELDLAPQIQDFHASSISHDGNWIAYSSSETGTPEVYVRPFPDITRGKWQASTTGGFAPLWSNSSNELFYYRSPNFQMKVTYSLGPINESGDPGYIDFETPEDLFSRATTISPTTQPVWAFSSDRDEFLLIEPTNSANESQQVLSSQTNLVVIENIYTELNSLVPVN